MSNKKLFGTDGIRGVANHYPIMPDIMTRIGAVAGHIMRMHHTHHTNRVLIGKDTRRSSYMVEKSIASGLLATGMNVFLVGPVPTPAVGFLTRSMRCDLGVMISASHNEYQDNGIKFFDHNGEKITTEMEQEIEEFFHSQNTPYCAPEDIGRAKRLDDVVGRYVEFVKKTFPQNETLFGMKIVIDTANGAAYKIAHEVLWELGADVIPIGNAPDGKNINLGCGSTKPELLQKVVIENNADVGIAVDGDADRLIMVDENGSIIDGDQIIAAIAIDMHKRDKLNYNTVVTTIMSNLAMEQKLQNHGISMIRTDVGDKNVYKVMKEGDFSLGGEQSGHIILKKYATTGDGLMTAIHTLSILKRVNLPASKAFNVFTPLPQMSEKVRYNKANLHLVNQVIQDIKDKFINNIEGRLIIRKSGTEPIIRIMIESAQENISFILKEIVEQITLKIA